MQTAGGIINIVDQVASLEFVIDRTPKSKFKETFYILPGDLLIVLLGHTFLVNEGVQIDYR